MKIRKGFTLIELLVVIAIIALLLAIIIPSLSLAKKKAASVVCMVNVKNLSLGWYSYKEDNGGHIMSSTMSGVRNEHNKLVPAWINAPYNTTPGDRGCQAGSPIVTDDDEINGIRDGALHPYLKSPDSYNCPADKVKSLGDGTEKFVTYTLPMCLQSWPGSDSRSDTQIEKYSEITSPATRYNFIESAEERNWNMNGRWAFGAPEYTGNPYYLWWGPMAVNHGDSSVLGFCDGHAEVRKWHDPWTKERIRKLSETIGVSDMYDPDGSGKTSENSEDIAYNANCWTNLD